MSQLRNLPDWLLAPLQSENIIGALRRYVPEIASGEWSIQSCSIKRFFLKDDSGYWEGTYDLTVHSAPTGLKEKILLHGRLTAPGFEKAGHIESGCGSFGSPSWGCFLPELCLMLRTEQPEKELPALPQLTDPELSRGLVENSLREGGRLEAEQAIASCRLYILSYKPGCRCTIRYELEYLPSPDPSARTPQVLIGKIYRKGHKSQNAYEGMRTLWHSPLADGRAVTFAEPIAWLPDLKMMLQTAISAETSLEDLLKSVLRSASPEEQHRLQVYMKKTAAGLVAFHQSGAVYGEHALLGDRLAEIHGLAQRLTILFPKVEAAVLPLLERLDQLAAIRPQEPGVPTHGTFNPEQVLIDGERIGFIDFDDYCTAEPAMDVGLFRAAIKDTGMYAPFGSSTPAQPERLARLAQLDEIADVFLDEYQRHGTVSRERVALWEAADYLRNCLHFWIKVKPAEPDNALLILDQDLKNCESNHIWGL